MTDKYTGTKIKFLSDAEISHLEQEIDDNSKTYGHFTVTHDEFVGQTEEVYKLAVANSSNFTILNEEGKPSSHITLFYNGKVDWEDYGPRLLATLQGDRMFSVRLSPETWRKIERINEVHGNNEVWAVETAIDVLYRECTGGAVLD